MKEWFIHVQGEIIGPLVLDTVQNLLKLNRVTLLDFIWTPGKPDWARLSDLEEFASCVPPFPASPIPIDQVEAAALQTPPHPRIPIPDPLAPDAPTASTKLRIRRHERVRIGGHGMIEGKGRFELQDISESGVFFRAEEPIPLGVELRFQLESELLGRGLTISGKVVRSGIVDGCQGFAVEFTGMLPMDRGLIQTYVRAVRFRDQTRGD